MQQTAIERFPRRLCDVIRMNDEADEAVLFQNQFGLRLPQINRVLFENVQEHVILNRSYGQLEHFSDEVRHDCAASAGLRVQTRGVGD